MVLQFMRKEAARRPGRRRAQGKARMKKAILSFLILTAVVCGAMSLPTAAVRVGAQEKADSGTSLLTPQYYEEYLELENPSDVAFNDDYIAVADGNVIYLYDRAAGTYSEKALEEGTSVSSLNFYGNNLYFVAKTTASSPIVYIDCTDPAKEQTATGIGSCASFVINGETVYYSIVTAGEITVYSSQMQDNDIPAASESFARSDGNTVPAFAVDDGSVYFSLGTSVYNAAEPSSAIATLTDAVAAFGIVKEDSQTGASYKIYYSSTSSDGFFLWNGSEKSEIKEHGQEGSSVRGIKSIKPYGGDFYLVTATAVKRYAPADNAFDGYEIGKRTLTDLSAYGSRIVVTDRTDGSALVYENGAGRRVLLRNGDASLSPDFVCAGEGAFLVASGNAFYVFSYEGTAVRIEGTAGAPIAAAYAYGSFYAVSDIGSGIATYKIGEDGTLAEEGQLFTEPVDLASDLFGNLYALTAAGNAYRFTEEEFLGQSVSHDPVAEFGAGAISLSVDCMGTLYALTERAVLKAENGSVRSYPLSFEGCVYNGETKTAAAFTFGFEEAGVYVLSDGFIIKTDAPQTASLKNLAAGDTYEQIFTNALTEESVKNMTLITLPADSVLVSLDGQNMEGDVLPYNGYRKTETEMTGVVLAETEFGTVAAFYDGSDYEIALLPEGNQTETIASDKFYTENTFGGYTTNKVGLYRFTAMFSADAPYRTELNKSAGVTVLGEVRHDALDAVYYFVSAQADGETVYGFVPAGYVLEGSAWGGPDENEPFRYAQIDKGESAVLNDLTATATEGETPTITLRNEETLKVYYELKNEDGLVWAEYERDGAVVAAGYIDESILYRADDHAMIVVAVVLVVTAVVLVSVAYLLLRKQPKIAA